MKEENSLKEFLQFINEEKFNEANILEDTKINTKNQLEYYLKKLLLKMQKNSKKINL